MSHVIVIDNFYPDLNWLQPYLASETAKIPPEANYAGVVYRAPLEQTAYALAKIKNELNLKEELSADGHGEIRLAVAADSKTYRSFIHADPAYNVIIYLSGKEGEDSGTHFYRHKQLGLVSIPDDELLQKKMSFLMDIDSKFPERWELIEKIPFKVNRAILFDGRYFHSGPILFEGSTPQDGRLTQNFFFQNLL